MSDAVFTYRPAAFKRELIEDADHLHRALDRLQQSDALGVDLEMVQRVDRKPGGYQDWVQVLALIQIASRDYSIVVDPVRCRDLSLLGPVLAGSSRKVFLGGGQDASLLEKAEIPARNVVDLGEVALAIFGRREDGMAALSQRIFGLSLDKTVRRTDWMARPLNPVLLAYAHRDAELTLLIYDWLRDNYPDVVTMHERLEFDPSLPPGIASWIREIVARASADPLTILMERRLDSGRDATRLSADLIDALRQTSTPRQTARLLRIAGELQLKPVAPEAIALVESPSSVLRAAAARTVGLLADVETGRPILLRLRTDEIEDVRKAAEAGLRDIKMSQAVTTVEEEDEETSSLNENALAALQQLMAQLNETSE